MESKKRTDRQAAIREIVRGERIRTQRGLSARLREYGYICTQATVSRDINEMGIKKLSEGIYVLAEDLHLQRMVSDLVQQISRTGNLVLIKASTGTAPGIAAALDAAGLPGVIGSIAGDDTILVIATSDKGAEEFEDTIDKLRVKKVRRKR